MDSVLLFPTPFSDETIFSLVSRYHQISGSLGVRRTLTTLFGAVTKSYASDLPCYLAHLEAALDCTHLVEGHTLLPYFEPFLTAARAQRAKELMQTGSAIGLKLELGITAAGFEKFQARRYCPSCVAADSANFGVSYWHVSHQAAGMYICPKHHCYLHRVYTDPRRGDFNQLGLPSEIIRRNDVDAALPLSAQDFSGLNKLAELIGWGMLNPQSISRLFRNNYLHFIINRAGFISNGRICASKLEEYFKGVSCEYPNRYEFQRIFELHKGRIVWPLDLLRRRSSSHHPLLFYIFISCLDINLSRLLEDVISFSKYNIIRKVPPSMNSPALNDRELLTRRQLFVSNYASAPAKSIGSYTWLYRHDNAWLRSYISDHKKPSSSHDRIDWAVRDIQLSGAVLSAVSEIKAIIGAPVQVSLAAICRFLSVPPDTFRPKNKLPDSIRAIKDNLENRHDYQLRKLAWAAKELMINNKSRTKSNLLRKSNIRICYLSEKEISRFIA
ncbi:TnsD family Tn7-like transposition protein [Pseudomonas agarici]|uniref:TnsD family Tn7-like transposition protein n=1 Tax=Pseudomonas agarici TaxID=46677 RepID=UPI0015A20F6B|nr:TniQ family protein [Pseudomonas agarici]NWB93472.1 TniQ family protein [Pseudomonas agarici]